MAKGQHQTAAASSNVGRVNMFEQVNQQLEQEQRNKMAKNQYMGGDDMQFEEEKK